MDHTSWVMGAWFVLPLSVIGFWAVLFQLGPLGSKPATATIFAWIGSYLILLTNDQLPTSPWWVIAPSLCGFIPFVLLNLASARVARLNADLPQANAPVVRRQAEEEELPIPKGQTLLAQAINRPILIHYLDQQGAETTRTVVVQRAIGLARRQGPGRITRVSAYCTMRKEMRMFLRDGILTAADPQTGELIEDLDRYLLAGRAP